MQIYTCIAFTKHHHLDPKEQNRQGKEKKDKETLLGNKSLQQKLCLCDHTDREESWQRWFYFLFPDSSLFGDKLFVSLLHLSYKCFFNFLVDLWKSKSSHRHHHTKHACPTIPVFMSLILINPWRAQNSKFLLNPKSSQNEYQVAKSRSLQMYICILL